MGILDFFVWSVLRREALAETIEPASAHVAPRNRPSAGLAIAMGHVFREGHCGVRGRCHFHVAFLGLARDFSGQALGSVTKIRPVIFG